MSCVPRHFFLWNKLHHASAWRPVRAKPHELKCANIIRSTEQIVISGCGKLKKCFTFENKTIMISIQYVAIYLYLKASYERHFILINFVTLRNTKMKLNSWAMNIKQNARSCTRTTHDKFCRNKIPNGRLTVFFNPFYSLSRKSCILSLENSGFKMEKNT